MEWSNPERFRVAQTTALGRLAQAKQLFVQGVAPRLTPDEQRVVYEQVMADPAKFDRVVQKYGVEGVARWQKAMAAK